MEDGRNSISSHGAVMQAKVSPSEEIKKNQIIGKRNKLDEDESELQLSS